jgi:hypothetical protein
MTSFEHLKQMETNIIKDNLDDEIDSKVGESEDA